MYRNENESGFTMIELMVVISILGILMIHFLSLLDFSYQYLGDEKEKYDQRSNFRVVSIYLLEDVMFSKDVEIVEEADGERVLAFYNPEGQRVELKFVEEDGLYMLGVDGWSFVVEGYAYDEEMPMVSLEGNNLNLNFHANSLNALLYTKIRVR